VGRPHVAAWAETEIVLAADLGSGTDDPRASAPDLLRRALAALPERARAGGRVAARVDAGVICCPAASARCRSRPARKYSPASCAAAIPVSSSPAPKPRSRCLTGPTAASSASITPSRSHSSLTTASPELGVSAASGAPVRACRRFRFLPRILATR
jgi:hypothetical protein